MGMNYSLAELAFGSAREINGIINNNKPSDFVHIRELSQALAQYQFRETDSPSAILDAHFPYRELQRATRTQADEIKSYAEAVTVLNHLRAELENIPSNTDVSQLTKMSSFLCRFSEELYKNSKPKIKPKSLRQSLAA